MGSYTRGPWGVTLQGTMPNGVRMFWLKEAQVSIGTANKADAELCSAAPDMAEALVECANDLEAELRDRWGDDPRVAHKLERDLAPVVKARAALKKAGVAA